MEEVAEVVEAVEVAAGLVVVEVRVEVAEDMEEGEGEIVAATAAVVVEGIDINEPTIFPPGQTRGIFRFLFYGDEFVNFTILVVCRQIADLVFVKLQSQTYRKGSLATSPKFSKASMRRFRKVFGFCSINSILVVLFAIHELKKTIEK